MVAALACKSAPIDSISSVKIGNDKDVSTEHSSFGPKDTIYVVTVLSNAGKAKVKGRVVVEDVAGANPGPIPGTEVTNELQFANNVTFTYTPPTRGWPAGKYKVEVILMNEDGEQKDQKTVSFVVS